MIEEILEKVMLDENLITINANIGVATDFVIEAMQRDPIPDVHV
jgi:hypothetical protein